MTARLALLAAVAVLLVPVGALFVFALRAEAWGAVAGMVAAFALGAGLPWTWRGRGNDYLAR